MQMTVPRGRTYWGVLVDVWSGGERESGSGRELGRKGASRKRTGKKEAERKKGSVEGVRERKKGGRKENSQPYLCSLLKRPLINCHQNNRMRAELILRLRLHILNNVLARREIHKRLRAQLLQTHLLFLIPRIDRDHPQPHRLRVLLRQRPQPAARADDRDGLARPRPGLFQPFVDGDAGTEDRRDGVERDVFV